MGAFLGATYDHLSATRLIAPMGNCKTIGRNADLTRGMNKIPMILNSEVRAILDLAPLERFVFVMSVLERYSDNDCSILLGCARREIAIIRARAMQQLGRSNDPAASRLRQCKMRRYCNDHYTADCSVFCTISMGSNRLRPVMRQLRS